VFKSVQKLATHTGSDRTGGSSETRFALNGLPRNSKLSNNSIAFNVSSKLNREKKTTPDESLNFRYEIPVRRLKIKRLNIKL
jgi:hypothetical protein